jgi:hypothetical protein
MTTNSINQPWAISDKIRNRYGNTWADIDFTFNEKISQEVFREDPMNTLIGTLEVAGAKIKFKYKDLIGYTKSTAEQAASYCKIKNETTFPIDIKSFTLQLTPHEITRVAETLHDAMTTVTRAYELGLYL